MTPEQIEELATNGALLDISSNVNLKPDTLESLLNIVVEQNSQLIISARNYSKESLLRFSKIGGKHLTIKF